MNGIKAVETEKKVYSYIEKNPGVHISKLVQILDIKFSNIEICLNILEQKNKIYSIDSEGFKRYYINKMWKSTRKKRTQELQMLIFNLLNKNPGLHLSKIAQDMGMSVSLAKYHLRKMEKNELILSIKDEKKYYKRYYTKDSEIGKHNKEILELLRKQLPLKIVLFLLKNSQSQHKDISNKLNIAPSKLTYHLTQLEAKNIITVQTYGKNKGYSITSRKEIIDILHKYILKLEIGITLDKFIKTWNSNKENKNDI